MAILRFKICSFEPIVKQKEPILAIFTAILGVTQKLTNPYSYSLLGEIGCKSGEKVSNCHFLGPRKDRRQLQTQLAKVEFQGKTAQEFPKIGF